MLETDSAVHADPAATRTTGPTQEGPLTFAGNRAISAARRKTPGTTRIVVVGDSMAWAAGIEVRKGLAMRLAFHLNGALPGSWVEGLAFGSSGACLYDAAARTITQAVPIAPDIAIMALCCNDAFLLGPQPPQLEAIGRQWITFRPLIRRGLEAFRDAVIESGGQPMVVYLDHLVNGGEVCVPEEIGSVCAELGLAFFDGSKALLGFQITEITVSPADGHLNEFANDIIARQVAQMILSRNWLPSVPGFGDAAWMQIIEREAEARVEAGLSPAIAFGEALSLLERKWLHRRNSSRRQLEKEYTTVRERMLEAQRSSLGRLLSEALGARLRRDCPLGHMMMVEMWANQTSAAIFGLEHLIATGHSDEALASLEHLARGIPAGPLELDADLARWRRVREKAAKVQEVLRADAALDTGAQRESGNRDFRMFWTSRVSNWCHTVEYSATRYIDLLPAVPASLDAGGHRLLAYLSPKARAIEERLDALHKVLAWILPARAQVARAAGTGWVALELSMVAKQGPEYWYFNIGIEGVAPGFSERYLGGAIPIRDGQLHTYTFDIPLMLFGQIHLYFEGEGFPDAIKDGLSIRSARIRWPHGNLPDVELARPAIEFSGNTSLGLVYRNVLTLPVSS